MIQIIETNLSMDGETIKDFQSRIIEVDSWGDYIDEIKEGKTIVRSSIMGNLHGISVPRQSRIENLEYDDVHLSCDIYNYQGLKSKKLAYVVR